MANGCPQWASLSRNATAFGILILMSAACGSTAASPSTSGAAPSTTSVAATAVPVGAQWFQAHKPAVIRLQSELTAVSSAGQSTSAAHLLSVCRRLGRTATRAEKLPPIRSARIQGLWGSFLADLSAAALDCRAGIREDDAGLKQQYKLELAGAAATDAALLKELQGHA